MRLPTSLGAELQGSLQGWWLPPCSVPLASGAPCVIGLPGGLLTSGFVSHSRVTRSRTPCAALGSSAHTSPLIQDFCRGQIPAQQAGSGPVGAGGMQGPVSWGRCPARARHAPGPAVAGMPVPAGMPAPLRSWCSSWRELTSLAVLSEPSLRFSELRSLCHAQLQQVL